VTDLQDVARLGAPEIGLAVVAVARPDGTVLSSVVNVGVMDHPATGEPIVAFVTEGSTRKLALLRAGSRIAVTVRQGWEWATVEGIADLAGPKDTLDGFPPDGVPQLLRDIFTAAGGTHDNWDEYDRVMAEQGRTAVLIRPQKIYGSQP
jgi:PPOX class probable F420-dependent enzyme